MEYLHRILTTSASSAITELQSLAGYTLGEAPNVAPISHIGRYTTKKVPRLPPLTIDQQTVVEAPAQTTMAASLKLCRTLEQ